MADDLALSSTVAEGQGTDGARAPGVPRSISPEERSIYVTRLVIERMGADPLLNEAIGLLFKAQAKVAEFYLQRANAGTPNPLRTAEGSANT